MRIELFKAIDWYVDNPLELIDTPGDIAVKIETDGVGVSVFTEDGNCIGCGGIIYWEDDVAEAWIRIDRKGLKYRKSGLTAIREGFRIIIKGCKDTQIFCWVDTEWPEAQRMVKWLGFIEGEEVRELNNKMYKMWEYNHGNGIDGIGNGSICCRTDAAGFDDEAASQCSSRNS